MDKRKARAHGVACAHIRDSSLPRSAPQPCPSIDDSCSVLLAGNFRVGHAWHTREGCRAPFDVLVRHVMARPRPAQTPAQPANQRFLRRSVTPRARSRRLSVISTSTKSPSKTMIASTQPSVTWLPLTTSGVPARARRVLRTLPPPRSISCSASIYSSALRHAGPRGRSGRGLHTANTVVGDVGVDAR
jgi:hypothetical protein